eukprot:6474129-Amphidinium_carterae.1
MHVNCNRQMLRHVGSLFLHMGLCIRDEPHSPVVLLKMKYLTLLGSFDHRRGGCLVENGLDVFNRTSLLAARSGAGLEGLGPHAEPDHMRDLLGCKCGNGYKSILSPIESWLCAAAAAITNNY